MFRAQTNDRGRYGEIDDMSTAVAYLALSVAAILVGACAAAPMSSFDRQFIDMMVPHHQGAIEMARIAAARATHPELKAMSESVIKSQESEIDQMKSWRKAWFGSDETPPLERMPMVEGMGHGGTNMKKDAEMRRSAAEPFDRQFIDTMREHHRSAIEAARLAQTKAERGEIKELAGRILADQQREIDQMTEWRLAWYGSN